VIEFSKLFFAIAIFGQMTRERSLCRRKLALGNFLSTRQFYASVWTTKRARGSFERTNRMKTEIRGAKRNRFGLEHPSFISPTEIKANPTKKVFKKMLDSVIVPLTISPVYFTFQRK